SGWCRWTCNPCGVPTCLFFFSSRRRHTRLVSDWSSDVCSSDLHAPIDVAQAPARRDPFEVVRGHGDGRGEECGLEVDGDQRGEQIGRASCRERVETLVAAV